MLVHLILKRDKLLTVDVICHGVPSPMVWRTYLAELAFLIVCSTFITYFLIPLGQKRIRPTLVSMYSYVQPIIAVVISICIGMDSLTWQKVLAVLNAGLIPIMCCGETLEQREAGITIEWVRIQIKCGLAGVSAEDVKKVVVAYEPIWAIGTGKTATSEQAQEVCHAIRVVLAEMYGQAVADEVRIQYGGSVNAKNAAELFAMEDIDGGLVGGASLKEEFTSIVHYEK